jgi:hypothetical protein
VKARLQDSCFVPVKAGEKDNVIYENKTITVGLVVEQPLIIVAKASEIRDALTAGSGGKALLRLITECWGTRVAF